ncbi:MULTISPECIES: helix-turn-helix domain-containing protein [Proteus]|uniref:helix-turn-helix domain-containing protein n=2 Tax=Proteus TaxID=583 RepID=UPI001D02E032|nr:MULTISPECIES: helix-turn-helix transcriptional regulator [Proteus]MCO8052555.1 helix-turn-helix domain-containing protein [Proteus penneri]UDF25119.1 helix-turn-helix domain-containing protein [Proteus terrae subsp. cibarius]
MDTLDFIIGHKIKQKRMELKLTGKQMSNKLGISQQHYSRVENGGVKITVEHLFSIAFVLGVKPQNLLPDYYISDEQTTKPISLISRSHSANKEK